MTLLSLYKILFIIEILIGESIFSFKLEKKKGFIWKLPLSLAICLSLAIFYPLPKDLAYSSWYTSIMFLLLALSTFIYLGLCFKANFSFMFFSLLTSYTFQQMSYMIYSIIITPLSDLLGAGNMYGDNAFDLSEFNRKSFIVLLIYLDAFILSFGIEYFIFRKKLKKIELIKLRFNNLFLLIVLLLVVDIVLNAVVTYSKVDLLPLMIIYIYNFVCCLLLIYIENSIITNIDMSRENELINQALVQANKQYELQKETVNLINIKCHDLKHQISKFEKRETLDSESIKEIKDLIKIYDSSYQTKNEVLNIILTEKSLICSTKNIILTTMIEAEKLNYMNQGDLYSLFGNILDNAIEASSNIEDIEKRVIALNIFKANDFIIVKCSNYYQGELSFKDDLPLTKKEDKNYHGYGMKSIKNIVEKYNGQFKISTSNNIFELVLTLPILERICTK